MLHRVEVLYSGHVQGVGFRYNACQQASDLAITGWVKNLPNRRVQLIAEGSIDDLKRLLQRIDQSMQGNIRDKTIDWQQPTGKLSVFGIEH